MKIAINIQAQENVTWPQWLALARAVEAAGLDGLYTSDHYQSVRDPASGGFDAWTAVAGIAACTERLRLGTLVTPVTFRSPALLAKIVTTVDHISDGRVDVGLGIGWHEREHHANGFPFPTAPERLQILAEQLQILERAWSGEPYSHDGSHYRIAAGRAAPRPVQRPHPPLIIGGNARHGTLALAARWADEYNTSYVTPAEAKRRRERWHAACAAAGRAPAPFSVMTGVVVAETDDEVQQQLDKLHRAWAPDENRETFLSAFGRRHIIGDLDAIRRELDAFADAGVSRILLGMDASDLSTIELLGRLNTPANQDEVGAL